MVPRQGQKWYRITCPSPKLKLSFLSSDFQEIVQTSFESEPANLAVPTSEPGKLLQDHPLPPPSHHPFLRILRKSLQPSLRQMQLKSQMFRLWEALCTMLNMWGLRWEMTHHVCCMRSRRKKSEFLRTWVMTLTTSMTWITFVLANEFTISRETRMGILLFPSNVLGLNRQIIPILI